jgi:peptide/nickel transport system substrate-binding protein
MLGEEKWSILSVALVIGATLLAPCAPQATPQVAQVKVTRIVKVEGKDEAETIAETETIIVTATPEPQEPVEFKSEEPNTLYAHTVSDPNTLDPAWNYEIVGDAIILNVYEQLVTYDGSDTTSFVPALAESWEVSDNGRTYVFKIRQGIKFHEGQDLTAGDVACSRVVRGRPNDSTPRRSSTPASTTSPSW